MIESSKVGEVHDSDGSDLDRSFFTADALAEYERQWADDTWTIYDEDEPLDSRRPLSRTGNSLSLYPINSQSPSSVLRLLNEAEILGWWCPLPGCELRRPKKLNASEVPRDFMRHWMCSHTNKELSGIQYCETGQDLNQSKTCTSTLYSLSGAQKHWKQQHGVALNEDCPIWTSRRREFLSLQLLRFGAGWYPPHDQVRVPKPCRIVRVDPRSLPTIPSLDELWVTDPNKRRQISLEGYYRKVDAPKELPVTRQNWQELPVIEPRPSVVAAAGSRSEKTVLSHLMPYGYS